MADLNSEFRKFNDTIKLDWDDQLQTLRDKRDLVLDRLRSGLPTDVTKPNVRNQGSYAMGTGIVPIAGDYDVDVALEFELDPATHDPVTVKRWVYDAVVAHTKRVEVREPCVTVWWQRKDEPIYHVDLAVYAVHDGNTFLARGKLGAGKEQRSWEPADPKALVALLKEQPDDAEFREQRRRVIRYLKRWKDLRFSSEGEAAPRGIALTACALRWFAKYDLEIDALTNLVAQMHGCGSTISVSLPVPPGNDLFGAMSTNQRENLHARLGDLLDALREAKAEPSPKKAAEQLRRCFGEDFPESKKTRPIAGAAAVGTSGASA